MKRYLWPFVLIVLSLVGLSAAALAWPRLSALGKLQDANAAPASGPIYTQQYSGFEFRAVSSALTNESSGSGLYATSLPNPPKSFRLALGLPSGAQVLTATIYLVDNDIANDMTLRVISYTAALTTSTQIAAVDTAGLPNTTTVQSLVIAGSPLLTVNNAQAIYAIQYVPVITGSKHILVGVRIDYTAPTNFLPAVSR